ncbi:MAG: GNAT family protein [Bacteroidales bacterium]|nr:GNAT family protein [Bacteroidales bacterium]
MRVYLRALELEDYSVFAKWRNDRELTDRLGGNIFYVSTNREKEWVESAIKDDRKNLHLAIVEQDNSTCIGMVNLTNIDHVNKKAEFSILIGDKKQMGKGYGKQAANLLLQHAFNQLNLNKVWLSVLKTNDRARKLYEKIGFKNDGLLRQDVYKNGAYQDFYLMSILKEEFTHNEL